MGNSVALLIVMTVSAAESITHECLSYRQRVDTENAVKIFLKKGIKRIGFFFFLGCLNTSHHHDFE